MRPAGLSATYPGLGTGARPRGRTHDRRRRKLGRAVPPQQPRSHLGQLHQRQDRLGRRRLPVQRSGPDVPLSTKTTDGGSELGCGDPAQRLADPCGLQFLDAEHGWALGTSDDGKSSLLQTTDGGSSWTRVTLPSAAYYLTSVHFVDAQHGWVGGDAVWATTRRRDKLGPGRRRRRRCDRGHRHEPRLGLWRRHSLDGRCRRHRRCPAAHPGQRRLALASQACHDHAHRERYGWFGLWRGRSSARRRHDLAGARASTCRLRPTTPTTACTASCTAPSTTPATSRRPRSAGSVSTPWDRPAAPPRRPSPMSASRSSSASRPATRPAVWRGDDHHRHARRPDLKRLVSHSGNWCGSPVPYYWLRFTCTLAPGSYRIVVRATDWAGNARSRSVATGCAWCAAAPRRRPTPSGPQGCRTLLSSSGPWPEQVLEVVARGRSRGAGPEGRHRLAADALRRGRTGSPTGVCWATFSRRANQCEYVRHLFSLQMATAADSKSTQRGTMRCS